MALKSRILLTRHHVAGRWKEWRVRNGLKGNGCTNYVRAFDNAFSRQLCACTFTADFKGRLGVIRR